MNWLLGDIGGTHSRLTVWDGAMGFGPVTDFDNVHFASLEDVIAHYLDAARTPVDGLALAVACPVVGERLRMTNLHWTFSASSLRERLAIAQVAIINDFTAIAWALPHLSADDRVQIGTGSGDPRAALAVLGPGTGLGVSALIPAGAGWAAIAGEGGHVTVAAMTHEEWELLRLLRARYGHVSAERVLSGPGIADLYACVAELKGIPEAPVSPETITQRAAAGEPMARKALLHFFSFLGTVAANVALTLGARGGVYLAGGVLPQMIDALRVSPFRDRFVDKGRYRAYLAGIPTYVVTAAYPGLLGLAAYVRRGV